ncbi:hypothetical protein FRC01_000584 [Tulasnella sp. 417]|nr:hypothetical protein FRC01_000584 [Tulasnella sp. 417]
MGYYLDADYKMAVLISQYMIHGDLEEYIHEQKPSWGARLHLIRDVTDGLAYLHGHTLPVVHGDLKMKNVLVLADRIPYAEKRQEHSILLALINNETPCNVESLSIPAPDLKNLLERCWAIQPSERPSAADCLRTIELALSVSPLLQATDPKPRVRVVDSSHIRSPERSVDPPRTTPRPFGIDDCPTFYPTVEEWKDSMAYIASISDRAKPYGICKIVPPEGWKMPFVLDAETYLQRLNSIEAPSRAKIDFLEQLYRYHQQQEMDRLTLPIINHKPLDLWLLRNEVQKRGDFDNVSRAEQWGEVARAMGYGGIPNVSTVLSNAYAQIILPFKQSPDQIQKSTSTPSLSPQTQYPPASAGAASTMGGRMGTAEQAPSKPPRKRARTDTPVKQQGDKRGPRASPSVSKTLLPKGTPLSKSPQWKEPSFTTMRSIGASQIENGDVTMTGIPKGDWFCYICLGIPGDYNFEGDDHSLHSLQMRDWAFRKTWFEKHRPTHRLESHNDPYRYKIGEVELVEDDVEREFWRLVESPLENVEVEYGANIHSITHGSASPSLATHPLDPYSRDSWNLNNMAIAPGSLLRYVKPDIPGMTAPWVYVGMVFSMFCWHNEDHFTYDVSYMHWGETQTWYGIPGDDAEKFEAAIKSEAPDLFEAQPDLLLPIITMKSPERLKDAGVRVYGCNQRPGEYVITFPKAYHAGFNHGLNLTEGVNFALPDWLNYGRECVGQYKENQKLPVFSHEELLITISQHSSSIETATWLLDSLQEMVDGHLMLRQKLRQAAPDISEVTEEHDVPEDQYNCVVCKGFSYLAQVRCQCKRQVACLEHWMELCGCPHSNRTLRKRFDDGRLLAILRKVQERSTGPTTPRPVLQVT